MLPRSNRWGVSVVTRGAGKRWLYDAKSGRWRHGGTFSAKPPRSALRKDKRGRLIDDAGRRVPETALPPIRKKKPVKKLAKSKASKPVKKKKAAVKPKAPKRPRKTTAKVKLLRGGLEESFRQAVREAQEEYGRGPKPIAAPPEITRITKGQTVVEKEFISSGTNRNRPGSLGEIHSTMLERAAAKGPFQPEDIVVYEHGLKFVGHERLSPEVLAGLQALAPEGGRIRYADTKAGTEVYVSLGSDPKIGDQTSKSFRNAESNLQQIYDLLLDYWDMVDWYEWFEADESLYG